ncbi:MAG: hypothetical protein D6767_07290 [Candidatus Hydrogenedentota bacterium]|nr:MAG: hypothetical protein D6767_07290 [Candidatus Hydrogenedentota bacterium]
MKKLVFYIILTLVFTGILLAKKEKQTSKVLFVVGSVFYKTPEKDWQQVKVGNPLPKSAEVKTSQKSTLLMALPDGSRLKLRGKTHILLAKIIKEKIIRIKRGGVFALVKPRSRGKFYLESPTHTAGVRGTQFFMAYGEKVKTDSGEETLMCVREGSVEFKEKQQEKKIVVNSGEGVIVAQGDPLSKKKLPWIYSFNWNMNPAQGNLIDETDIKKAYSSEYDILDEDYD